MKKSKKNDVLVLIQGDIVNAKLLNTFRELGINADMYYTDSSRVIFRMIGIKKPTDELYENYFVLLKLGENVDCSESLREVLKLAERIFRILKSRI